MDLKYIYTELEKERGKNCIITLMRNGLKSSYLVNRWNTINEYKFSLNMKIKV